jgi:hypothetical protein
MRQDGASSELTVPLVASERPQTTVFYFLPFAPLLACCALQTSSNRRLLQVQTSKASKHASAPMGVPIRCAMMCWL